MKSTKRLNRKKEKNRSKKKSKRKTNRRDSLKRRFKFIRSITKKKKKKLKQPLRAGLKKGDSAKCIGLLNLALKHIHQGEMDDIFTKEDHCLWSSGFLESGIKRGFKLMKSGNYQLDPNCNVVCLSNALLVYTMIKLDYHELSDLQKLYLFFLDYLNRSGNERTGKTLPLDYALKAIEKELSRAKEYHKKKVDENAKTKSIKTALKSIAKIESRKQEVIDRYKVDDDDWPWSGPLTDSAEEDEDGNPQVYWINEDTGEFSYTDPAESFPHSRPRSNINKVNICGSTDCIYLHEDEFIKNPELGEPIEKFCNHAILIFKGLIWMLMKEFSESDIHMYNIQGDGGGLYCEHDDCLESVDTYTEDELKEHMIKKHGKKSEPEKSNYENVIKLDLSMRALLNNTDSILVPINEIYSERGDTYSPGEEKFHDQEWIYHKMKKVLVSDLDDKKLYLTADLDDDDGDWGARWNIYDFLNKQIDPVFTQIEIIIETLPNGMRVPQLKEVIVGSITNHWYVAPKKIIYDDVSIQMAL